MLVSLAASVAFMSVTATTALAYDKNPPFKLNKLKAYTEIDAKGNKIKGYEPKNDYNVFINYELGMHCVGFSMDYCCVIPPYNSIQAQAVASGESGKLPKLLSPDDDVKLYYYTKDNSYSEGNKMKYWSVMPMSGGYLQYAGKNGGNVVMTDTLVPPVKDVKLVLTASHLWDALGLPLTAFNDSTRKGTIRSVTEKDFQPFQYSTVEMHDRTGKGMLHDAHHKTKFLADYKSDASGNRLGKVGMVNCADCHGDNVSGNLQEPRPTATGYKAVKAKPLSEALHGFHLGMVPMPDGAGRSQACQSCHPTHFQNPNMNDDSNPYRVTDRYGEGRFNKGDIRLSGGGCYVRRDAHSNPNAKPPFFLNDYGKWQYKNVSKKFAALADPKTTGNNEVMKYYTDHKSATLVKNVGKDGKLDLKPWNHPKGGKVPYAAASGGDDWWLAASEPHCADCHVAPFVEQETGGKYFPIDLPNKYSLYRYSSVQLM